jgi:hypothetical protein
MKLRASAGARFATAVAIATALAGVAGLAAAGCNDVGDSSAIPGLGISDEGASDALAPDGAEVPGEGGTPLVDGAAEAAPGPDDSSVAIPDATSVGTTDASQVDATVTDAGGGDAGAPDAGGADATSADAGKGSDAESSTDASNGADAGKGSDAGSDAGSGSDAGGGQGTLVPCTTAGQTGCVQCQFNNGADGTLPNASSLCTPTEAALVTHDIAAGTASVAGPDPDGSCYQCAALSGCLDDSEFNDQGHECEDISASGGAAACEATLACILQSSCGSTGTLSACFCGTAPVSGTCASVGANNGANGACKSAEASGLGFAPTDGLDILKNFTSTTLPAGVANNIFQCASSNGCTACLQ